MAWAYLVIAGLLEVIWAIGLKYTKGFTQVEPSIVTVAAMVASFLALSKALKTLPVGTAYAIWTGIGSVGTVIVGMILLGESRDPGRIFCLFLIITGIVGLKLVSR